MGAYDLVEIDVTIMRETPLAYLVDDGHIREWIPKALCEGERRTGDNLIADIPEWLFRDKGFF